MEVLSAEPCKHGGLLKGLTGDRPRGHTGFEDTAYISCLETLNNYKDMQKLTNSDLDWVQRSMIGHKQVQNVFLEPQELQKDIKWPEIKLIDLINLRNILSVLIHYQYVHSSCNICEKRVRNKTPQKTQNMYEWTQTYKKDISLNLLLLLVLYASAVRPFTCIVSYLSQCLPQDCCNVEKSNSRCSALHFGLVDLKIE